MDTPIQGLENKVIVSPKLEVQKQKDHNNNNNKKVIKMEIIRAASS